AVVQVVMYQHTLRPFITSPCPSVDPGANSATIASSISFFGCRAGGDGRSDVRRAVETLAPAAEMSVFRKVRRAGFVRQGEGWRRGAWLITDTALAQLTAPAWAWSLRRWLRQPRR